MCACFEHSVSDGVATLPNVAVADGPDEDDWGNDDHRLSAQDVKPPASRATSPRLLHRSHGISSARFDQIGVSSRGSGLVPWVVSWCTCSDEWAMFWGVIFPWTIGFLFYDGRGFASFINWYDQSCMFAVNVGSCCVDMSQVFLGGQWRDLLRCSICGVPEGVICQAAAI